MTYYVYIVYKSYLKKYNLFLILLSYSKWSICEMSVKLINFERLAEKRVNEAIKKIRLIGNLANKANYNYTERHSRRILEALEVELKNVKSKFKDEKFKGKVFTFDFKE